MLSRKNSIQNKKKLNAQHLQLSLILKVGDEGGNCIFFSISTTEKTNTQGENSSFKIKAKTT